MSSLQELDDLRIPLSKIKSITNDFADECIIGIWEFGKVYNGELYLHDGQLFNTAIKRLDRNSGYGDEEFWTDISIRSKLDHENLLPLVGFCYEDGERIIIEKYEANEYEANEYEENEYEENESLDIMSSGQELDDLRIPLLLIKSITNDFADENIIGSGGFGNIYKGELLHRGQLINTAIKRLDREYGQGDKQFWMDISIRSKLDHENMLPLVGFCDEDHERIVIDKYEANGGLVKYLSNPSLTWLRRLKICVGVARLLSYIHNDTGNSYDVIHRNIKSSKVMLDENWEAKVGGNGRSIKNPATRRHRLLTDSYVCGTFPYTDPAYEKTGCVSHKSDVYSFGVVMFEILCGREAFLHIRDQLLLSLAREAYEEGKLDEIIYQNMRIQMHPQSLSIFSEIAYHCTKEQRSQRPYMKIVAKRLEKVLELQRNHENPVYSKTPRPIT